MGDQEERTVARLLNPIPGEDDDERVPDLIVEGLLQETEEAEEEKEEVKEEVEMMSVQEEQGGRIEETLFLNVNYPTDPIDINSSQSFSKMAIQDPKDIKMSDLAKNDFRLSRTVEGGRLHRLRLKSV